MPHSQRNFRQFQATVSTTVILHLIISCFISLIHIVTSCNHPRNILNNYSISFKIIKPDTSCLHIKSSFYHSQGSSCRAALYIKLPDSFNDLPTDLLYGSVVCCNDQICRCFVFFPAFFHQFTDIFYIHMSI